MASKGKHLVKTEELLKKLDDKELEKMLDSSYSLAWYYMEKARKIKEELASRVPEGDAE